MQRDVPYEPHQASPQPGETGPSILDRPVTIAVLGRWWLVVAVAFVVAMLLRLPGLAGPALSAAEGRIALAAHGLVTGEGAPEDMLGMPAVVEWTALIMFAGDTVETVGRIAMAIAGLLIIPGVVVLGRWIGMVPAVAAAVLLSVSPTLVAASRMLDGGVLLTMLSLALLLSLLLTQERGGLTWPAVSGVAAGLLLLSGPLGTPAILFSAIGFILLARPAGDPERNALVSGIVAFAGTILLFGTVLFTRPGALPASFGELFSRLWSEHLAQVGERFHMVAFDLLFNEPLILLLVVIALFARAEHPSTMPLAVWSAIAFVTLSLLGGVGTAGYSLVVLPLALLAGNGAAHTLRRLPWTGGNRGHAALYVLIVLLLILAFLSVVGLITGATGQGDATALPQIALVLALIVVPLAVGLAALGPHVAGLRLLLVAVAAFIALSGITVRSSVLAASERPGQPGSMLTADTPADSVPVVVERIHRISRDLTFADRDLRDPVGGHGLRVAIDDRIAQPFAWHFRDYPNAAIFDPDTEPPPEGAQLIILSGAGDIESGGTEYERAQYVYGYEEPELYTSPDWTGLVSGLFDISDWRRFGDFLLNRQLTDMPEVREFQVLAIPSISERLFPATGPYSLDDRAGAGAADGQFNQPRGITVADDGSVFVVDSGNFRVQRFTPDGEFDLWFGGQGEAEGELGQFPGSGVAGPGGIATGPEGNIYVADTWNHRIQVFAPEGEFLRAWGSFFDAQDDPERASTEPGGFYGPRGVTVHDDMVLVADTGNERVQIFDLQGEFIRMFGSTGDQPGQLSEPVGVAVTGDDTVLVADSHNARIARFTLEGEPLDPWPVPAWDNQQFFEPYLAVGPDGQVYASSSATGEIVVFGPDGELLGTVTSPELSSPYGIAIPETPDRLLVTDGLVNAVLRVSGSPQ